MLGILSAAAKQPTMMDFLPTMAIWIVVVGGLMYFMSIRPQKKERERMKSLLDGLELGDSVLTTCGFYGVVIDIMDEIVVVEFGSNKNCRIPMKKGAIIEIEKSNSNTEKPKTEAVEKK